MDKPNTIFSLADYLCVLRNWLIEHLADYHVEGLIALQTMLDMLEKAAKDKHAPSLLNLIHHLRYPILVFFNQAEPSNHPFLIAEMIYSIAKDDIFSLADYLCYLRHVLIETLEQKNDEHLESLGTVLGGLSEILQETPSERTPFSAHITQMQNAITAFHHGKEGRNMIPPVEQIRASFLTGDSLL
jgi:hypothetical protein